MWLKTACARGKKLNHTAAHNLWTRRTSSIVLSIEAKLMPIAVREGNDTMTAEYTFISKFVDLSTNIDHYIR